MHGARRDEDRSGRAQLCRARVQPGFHPPALDQQRLVQVTVAMWPNDPIVQPAAGRDGLDMDQPLIGGLQRFAI